LALWLPFAACATKEDNTLGVGFIENQGELKAVRFLAVSPPDTSVDYQLSRPAVSPGFSSVVLVGMRSGYRSRALVRFGSEAFPDSGTVVDSAFVRFEYLDGIGDTDPLPVALHRITAPWTENFSLADSTLPAFLPEPVDTVTFALAAGGDTVAIPVTDLARFWVDAPDSNFGFLLSPLAGTASQIELGSRQTTDPPVLDVHWSDGGVDTSISLASDDDTFLLETTPDFVTLSGQSKRVTVARGVPGRALLRFGIPDRDSLPELWIRSTVNRAALILYIDPALSSFRRVGVGAQRVLAEPWAGDGTDVDNSLYGVNDAVTEVDSVSIDVFGLLAELFVEGEENHGFQVRALDERPDTDYIRFHAHDSDDSARRPVLHIWYTPGDQGDEP
jgi:hypothetical protein